MIYGYARISTDGQSLDAQRAELTAAGCAKVFCETASGTRTDRPRLARALDALDPGDVLVVTRLDRLARSTRDLLAAIAEKGAAFCSLRDARADTTTPHGRSMVTVLAGLAEFERELIVARTSVGREVGLQDHPDRRDGPEQVQPHRRTSRTGCGDRVAAAKLPPDGGPMTGCQWPSC